MSPLSFTISHVSNLCGSNFNVLVHPESDCFHHLHSYRPGQARYLLIRYCNSLPTGLPASTLAANSLFSKQWLEWPFRNMTQVLILLCSKPLYGCTLLSVKGNIFPTSLRPFLMHYPISPLRQVQWPGCCFLSTLLSQRLCICYPLCLRCCSSDIHHSGKACFFTSASEVLPDQCI